MTQNNDTSYRQKGRAAFLATLMVLSVVAIGFTTGAAAVESPDEGNPPLASEYYQGESFYVNLSTTAGQGANAEGPGAPSAAAFTTGDKQQNYLVRIDRNETAVLSGTSRIGSISNESDTSDWYGEIDLEDVEAGEEYGISNTPSYSSNTVVTGTFTVADENFGVSWDEASANGGDSDIPIELSSDRPTTGYNVTVSVDGPGDFGNASIYDLFDLDKSAGDTVQDDANVPVDGLEDFDRDDNDGVAELEDDGYVTINLANVDGDQLDGDELSADFSNLNDNEGLPDAGEYEFEFYVTDTGSTATDSIQISEQEESVSFAEGTTQTPAGDISEFEVTLEDTTETLVQIGGEDSDFVDVLYLEADNEDEPIEVAVNTRTLGASNQTAFGAVYDTENTQNAYSEMTQSGGNDQPLIDDIGGAGELPGDLNTLYEDDGSSENNDFDEYLRNMDLIDSGESRNDLLTRPMQTTDYEVRAAATLDEDHAFDADAGGEANSQLDSKVIELTAPTIGDITLHTAPEGSADDADDVSELVDSATPIADNQGEVALDDRAIVQVEATGLYGAIAAGATNSDTVAGDADSFTDFFEGGVSSSRLYNVVENSNESINFDITAESTTGNQDPLEVDLEDANGDDSTTYVYLDEENGQFFVVIDTSQDNAFQNGGAPDSATTLTTELEYDADNSDNRHEFQDGEGPFSASGGSSGSYVNYPYLLQGETLSSDTAELDLAPRSFDFDNLNEDEQVQAQNIEDSEISGETNVAPGSSAQIRVSSTDASSSFRQGNSINISTDGSVSTTYDLSGQEAGDTFEADFRVGGSSVDTADGVIVESVSDTDDGEETNETDTDEDMDDGETEPADDGETNETTDDGGESTDDGTPGFGAVVALIALIGAALLAVRRQN